jgi:hypothetical protein
MPWLTATCDYVFPNGPILGFLYSRFMAGGR